MFIVIAVAIACPDFDLVAALPADRTMPPKESNTLVLQAGPTHNKANLMKANARVEQIVQKHSVVSEPTRVDPNRCGVHWCNRGGLPLNMAYCHQDLFQNLKKNGYDPKRPRPGFLIKHGPATIAKMHAHQESVMSTAPGLWPPMLKAIMDHSTVGFSHMTCTNRLFKNNVVSKLTGETFTVDPSDTHHAHVIENGHPCWILEDSVSDADLLFLQEWLNADQDQNQRTTEAQHIRTVQSIYLEIERTNNGQPPTLVLFQILFLFLRIDFMFKCLLGFRFRPYGYCESVGVMTCKRLMIVTLLAPTQALIYLVVEPRMTCHGIV